MKRLLLLSLALGFALVTFAQQATRVNSDLLKRSHQVEYTQPNDNITSFAKPATTASNQNKLAFDEVQLGDTYYDLQSNYSLSNRFYIFPDGTMGAVWTRGMTATAFPDRGSAYNYYDGTSWGAQPTARIEDRRCGWPNYNPFGTTGEIVVSHNGEAGLEISTRDTKGSGTWNQMNLLGPAGIENDLTWPRMVTSGTDNEFIHLFANTYVEYEGQAQTLIYARSDDGAQTWDPEWVILDGMGDSYYTEVPADIYTLDSQGNTVVLLVGNAWMDLFYMRTDDNGDTWDKTVVWEHPYPMFDWDVTIADTFFCVDNSCNVALDNNGKVHVVFGINRVAHFDVGTTYTLWPYYDGIGYWNEDMPTFSNDLNALAPPQYGYASSEMVEDVNYVGWMQDVDGSGTIDLNTDIMYYRELGPSTVPTITFDPGNNLYLLYSSTTETYVNDVYNYKHIWARALEYNGIWGDFIDLTSDITHIFDECFYPAWGGYSEGEMHYMYNADVTPGLAQTEDHGYQENRTIYGKVDAIVNPGVEENVLSQSNVSAYPNPAKDNFLINIDGDINSNVNVTLTNITGQIVKEIETGMMNTISVNCSDIEAGIYFYSVKYNNKTESGRIIIK